MKWHKTWLKEADIAWTDSRGRRADFHALRTTLCTMLNKSGVPIQTAMAIMRHTDIRLTTKTYNDVRLFDTSGAIEKLPDITLAENFNREKACRTGTDDRPETVGSDVEKSRVAGRVASLHFGRQKLAFMDTINGGIVDEPETPYNALKASFSVDRHTSKNNGEGGIRTPGTQWVHSISNAAPSATQTPLQGSSDYTIVNVQGTSGSFTFTVNCDAQCPCKMVTVQAPWGKSEGGIYENSGHGWPAEGIAMRNGPACGTCPPP